MIKDISDVKIFLHNKVKTTFYKWFQNGDLPDDEYNNPGDKAKIVRRFKSDEIKPFTRCPMCEHFFYAHGFIYAADNEKEADRYEIDGNMEYGQLVCPGSYILKTNWDGIINYIVINKEFICYCTDYETDAFDE